MSDIHSPMCKHLTLTFGIGGAEIYCVACGAGWMPPPGHENDSRYARNWSQGNFQDTFRTLPCYCPGCNSSPGRLKYDAVQKTLSCKRCGSIVSTEIEVPVDFVGVDNEEVRENPLITHTRAMVKQDKTRTRYVEFRKACAFHGSLAQIKSIGIEVGDRVMVPCKKFFKDSIGNEVVWGTAWQNDFIARVVSINEENPKKIRIISDGITVVNLQDGISLEMAIGKNGYEITKNEVTLVDPVNC